MGGVARSLVAAAAVVFSLNVFAPARLVPHRELDEPRERLALFQGLADRLRRALPKDACLLVTGSQRTFHYFFLSYYLYPLRVIVTAGGAPIADTKGVQRHGLWVDGARLLDAERASLLGLGVTHVLHVSAQGRYSLLGLKPPRRLAEEPTP
jgi:hypothetical protein